MYRTSGETCSVECNPKENYVIKQFKPRKPKYGWEVEPLRQTLDLCVQREIICLERLQNEKGCPLTDNTIRNQLKDAIQSG